MTYRVISEHLQDAVILPVLKVIERTPSIEAAHGAIKRTRAEFESRGYETTGDGYETFLVSFKGGQPLLAVYIVRGC